MVLLTSEVMLGRSFITVNEKFYFNTVSIYIHIRTDALHEFGDTLFCAVVFVGKERLFWQDSLAFQKISIAKFI